MPACTVHPIPNHPTSAQSSPWQTTAPADVHAYHAVARHGSWYEVHSIAGTDQYNHCHAPPELFRGVRLRLFVRVEDTVPVVVNAMQIDFDDDSDISVPLGLHAQPVEPGDPSTAGATHVLGGGDIGIPVELDAADVGETYPDPGDGSDVFPAFSRWIPLLDAHPSIGGRALIDQRPTPRGTGDRYCARFHATYPQMPSSGAWREAEKHVGLRVKGRHAQIRGDVETGSRWYESNCNHPECQGNGSGMRSFHHRVPGPTLYWPDGEEAGQAVDDVEIRDVRASTANPDHLCFALVGGIPRTTVEENQGLVRVCAPQRFIRSSGREDAALSATARLGPVSRPQVWRGLAGLRDELVGCAASPSDAASMFVFFEIGTSGVVLDAGSNREGPESVRNCVRAVMMPTEWPAGHPITRVDVFNVGLLP